MPNSLGNSNSANLHLHHSATNSAAKVKSQQSDSASLAIDSVAKDCVRPKYSPKYLAGFPDSSGNSLHFRHINELKVMTAPAHSNTDHYRYKSPLYDNGTILMVLAVIFFISVSYSKGYKYIADFFHNMFSVRKRENLFEDHTVKETQIMTALIANTCIFESIILYEAFTLFHPEVLSSTLPVFAFIGALTLFMAVFYLLQLGIYYLLGFIFADKVETSLWIDGFKASQSLLGIILAPVAFIMLIYPSTIEMMLFLSALLYFSARFVFICKAFRIFFNDLTSSLYFILYLCSVEIVPVILSFTGSMNLCIILQAV